jgi:uncharacterized protein involved in outer membrane biogenesis
MNKVLKRILIGLGVFVVVFVIAAAIAGYVIEGKISPFIMDEVNKEVTVPVQINGGIQFSLLRHFPYASLTFKQVVIDDKLQKGKQLLKVKEFSLLCNVMSLLHNKLELSKILISGGDINVFKDAQGHANYDILKPSQSTTTDTAKSKFSVQLRRAEIKNVNLSYVDRSSATDIDATVKDLKLKGDFSSSNFDLATTINGNINKLIASGQEVLVKRAVKADIVMSVNSDSQFYSFKKGTIKIDDNEFDITGSFTALKNGTQLDFKLVHAGKNIKNLIKLIPEKYRNMLQDAEGSGEYGFTAELKGTLSANSSPRVKVSADLKNSEFKLGKYRQFLKKVNATAKYEMDEKGRDKLVISNFNFELNESPFQFSLTLDDLSNPDFDFFAKGVFHVSELATFIPDSVISNLGGTITFNDFHLKGKKQDFIDYDNSTLTGSGQFKFNQIEFQNNGISYGNINGLLSYNNQTFDVQNFTVNFLGNAAQLSGSVKNLPAFAYNLSQNRNANNVVMEVNGALKVKTLNLSGILDTYNKNNITKAHAKVVATGKIDVREVMNMKGNLDVSIDKFIFRKLEFDNLKGNIQFVPGIVQCNNLDMQAMDGELKLNGQISFGDDYTMRLAYDVNAINLNVSKIFYECENFGQGTLTDKHLKGNLNANVSFYTVWRNYGDLDADSLTAVADFEITNGRLIKFEPLKAASKFIKVDELQDIHFARLANTIKIGNRRIDIPSFAIESSVLNVMMEGTHNFDNNVDYHFKINLHKLLAQKFNRKDDNIQYMEEDPYEGINLYLGLSGSLDNPQIKFDKGASKKKLKDDFKNEGNNFKNLMNNKPVAKGNPEERKREDKYFNTDQQPQFMEFDSSGK